MPVPKLRMPRIRLEPPEFEIGRPVIKMSPREAFFAEREVIDTDAAVGRTAANSVTVCPPCVPIVAAGEIVDENAVKILKMYSIFRISVVK